jgi:hypothetical protein
MSDDPRSPQPADAWLTATPAPHRPLSSSAEPGIEPRLIVPLPRSLHWGLASLLVGMPLFVATPIVLVQTRIFWTQGPQLSLPIGFAASLLAGGLILALAALGIFAGLRGWTLAVAERQPVALGLAGTVLNIVAGVCLLGLFIDLMAFFFHHMR